MLPLALLLLGALAALWVWGVPLLRQSKLHLPPRVPGFLHQFRPNLPNHLLRLAQAHGPLYRIHFGNQDVVILNSKELIQEAMIKNWLNFAGRPLTFSSKLVSLGGKDLSLGNYSPAWKDLKKLTRSALLFGMRNKMEPLVWQLTHQLCEDFRAQPGSAVDLFQEFSRLTNRIVCTLTFGEMVSDLYDCITELVPLWASPSISILDVFPFLRVRGPPRWGVGGWARRGARPSTWGLHETQAAGVVRDLMDYMLRELREKSGVWDVTEENLHMVLLDLVIGGTETTAATLTWVVLYLLHHPEIHRRLQEELDQELGPGRVSGSDPPASPLPYKDRERLPLLNATISEVLRLRPVVALGLPHRTLKDSSLGGFDIPGDTIVIPNLYGAHHDAAVWDQPFAFRPDRFLNPKSQQPLTFGCGARVCLGEIPARLEIFLILTQLLHRFTFSPVPPSAAAAAAALPSLVPDFGILVKAQPFRVHLLPREGGRRAAA
uniref:Steroid 21-hydroxylase n=1 Tax=Ornithorhynchus anatinus TaxID=9258 RepID=F6TFP9_ORNAN